MTLNEIIENFYKYILPITQSIVKYLIKSKDKNNIDEYRNIGKLIYKKTLDGSINSDEKIQNIIYDRLVNFEYTLERLNDLDQMEFTSLNESKLLKENIEVNPKLYIQLLNKCAEECCKELGIDKPKIYIINNPKYTDEHKSYAGFIPSTNEVKLVIYSRSCADSCRSLSHEILHAADASQGLLTPESGRDGDDAENRANSFAGSFLRKFGRENPNIYFLRYE